MCVCVHLCFTGTAFYFPMNSIQAAVKPSSALRHQSECADFTGLTKWHPLHKHSLAQAAKTTGMALYTVRYVCTYVCVLSDSQSSDWERDRGFLYVTTLSTVLRDEQVIHGERGVYLLLSKLVSFLLQKNMVYLEHFRHIINSISITEFRVWCVQSESINGANELVFNWIFSISNATKTWKTWKK